MRRSHISVKKEKMIFVEISLNILADFNLATHGASCDVTT